MWTRRPVWAEGALEAPRGRRGEGRGPRAPRGGQAGACGPSPLSVLQLGSPLTARQPLLCRRGGSHREAGGRGGGAWAAGAAVTYLLYLSSYLQM